MNNAKIAILAVACLALLTSTTCSHRLFTTDRNNYQKQESMQSPDSDFRPPLGWQRIDITDKATLYLPADMKAAQSLDESAGYTRIFSNASIRVTISYGQSACGLSDSHENLPSYKRSTLQVSGKTAELAIDSFLEPKLTIAYLCFPRLDSSDQLRLAAMCKGKAAMETAKQIFTSVRVK
jgi:hypothetical protein